MWRSRLEGLDVIEDVEKLSESLHNYADTNQLLISYEDSIVKIKRDNYFPDENGLVIFESEKKWLEDSYSVAEMLEFIEKYGELIKEIKFRAFDDSLQPLVNFSESCDASGVVWFTHIIVGDGSKPLTQRIGTQQSLYNPNVKTII